MAYIIGVLTPEEQKNLEARGWEFEDGNKIAIEALRPAVGDECPNCGQGTITKQNDRELVCAGECGQVWVARLVGTHVDNTMFSIMTGPDWEPEGE